MTVDAPSHTAAAPSPPTGALARLRANLTPLFEPASPRSLTWPRVALSVVLVLIGTAYSLGRVGGPGALDTIWGEDASNFLTDAYNERSVDTLFKPINGYFVVIPRVFADVAALFPVKYGAAVLTGLTALCAAAMGLLIYVASANVLKHPLARAVAAAGIISAPLGESMFSGSPNTACALHFAELYALFWCLMWTPTRRSGRVLVLILAPLFALSTFLTVFLIPVAVLRWWVRRDRYSLSVLGLLVLGAAVQAGALALGISSRAGISHPHMDPLWALRSYVTWALPYELLGQTAVRQPGLLNPYVHDGGGAGPWYWVAVVGAWALVGLVVLVALQRWTSPRWLFAGMAAVVSVGMLCGQIMVQGELVLRYAFAPGLLAVSALVALLLPRAELPRARALAPLVALAVLLGGFALASYRVDTARAQSNSWVATVSAARKMCKAKRPAVVVKMRRGSPWHVQIPCHRLVDKK